MSEVLVDTSVVIDYLRGQADARDYLEDLRSGANLATHVVVVAETLVGARDREEQQVIDSFFRPFRVRSVESTDGERSLDLFRSFHLAHGVEWLDCLIAATCLRLRVPVATLNDKHFSVFPDLDVQRPY